MPRKQPSKPASKKPVRTASKAAVAKAAPATVEAPAVPKPTEVKLTPAKGRPMLQWVGKKPLSRVTAFPAQFVESYDPAGELKTKTGVESAGNLYYGDNKEVLAHLLANGYRGKVDLIYIDPPFDSGADYVRKITLRGKSALAKLEGESYSLGEQVQYTDIWANDNYLQFMYERLVLLKELLAADGGIVLHANTTQGHMLRSLLDEVFGPDCFRNEITWHYDKYQMGGTRQFVDNTDRLFWYSKGDSWTYNLQVEKLDQPKQLLAKGWNAEKKVIENLRGPDGKTYKITVDTKKIDDFWELVDATTPLVDHDETSTRVRFERFPVSNAWLIPFIAAPSHERMGYPTQKPEALLERVLRGLSRDNDLVLDCFIGSGTTAAVAQKLGRRWIGCDINKGAIQTTSKRLQGVISDQLAEKRAAEAKAQDDLLGGAGGKDSEKPAPAALSFRIHRVNDYDLTVQHNEAVALACEHIGVTRTKADAYFDGTQGKRLVKIIPFNHPLSLTDLEQLKTELRAREKEERDILLVCLGKELACDTWLAEWGRLRKRGDVPNKIEVIELRTDPKYGKFIEHKPASAKVSVKRKGGELHVTIEDFISPTIIERLDSQDSRLFKAHVTDWRFMVDSVMIDPAYDGQTFHIALTDLPEKKTDLVEGSYTLPSPDGKTTVAVKITDMLGEEVVVMSEV